MPKMIQDHGFAKQRVGLRSSTALTLALMMGASALAGAAGITMATSNVAFADCAASSCAANPCAANASAANPCAANPCAADPCAADPCGANPCAASKGSATGCFVPRLQDAAANPCAADPCAANPCAVQTCAANPCAANSCAANTCAADACAANPCAANASTADPCAANPCAAKTCDANPGAANPCAANPCAANPCAAENPCAAANTCGACAASAAPPEVSEAEVQALYKCLMETAEDHTAAESNLLHASWSLSDRSEGREFSEWTNFASMPYISFTHGERFATNHANSIAAEQYGKFEDVEAIPAGGIIAKPTFSINSDGEALWETLFLMEKAEAGISPDTNDWIYTAIMPDGSLMGRTLGVNADAVGFCAACHMGMSDDNDDLLFMDSEFRITN